MEIRSSKMKGPDRLLAYAQDTAMPSSQPLKVARHRTPGAARRAGNPGRLREATAKRSSLAAHD